MKFITVLTIASLCLFISSCEEGPSGPHPSIELVTIYDLPPVTGIKFEVSGRAIVKGPLTNVTSIPMQHDTVSGTDIQLGTSPVSFGGTPTIRITFKKLPTAPGTFEFTAATVQVGVTGLLPKSDQGAFLNFGGNFYAPVSGTITITEVNKDANSIYGYSGYVNGQLKAMYPLGFNATASQPFPPGFNPASPTLVGETITLHSVVFKTRSRSQVSISGQ
ncbi:MAG: hypothetical protein H7X70_02975 [Candidatus Kapabacteria bacterium]|nr:hypothetical protein [Candidatus Kapabacteria bacterium]